MGWLLTILILGYPGDGTPRGMETHRFVDTRDQSAIQQCFAAEKSAKAWGRTNNLTVVTGCHPITEG